MEVSREIVGAFVVAGLVKGVIGLGPPSVVIAMLVLARRPAQAAALMIFSWPVTGPWPMVGGWHLDALAAAVAAVGAGGMAIGQRLRVSEETFRRYFCAAWCCGITPSDSKSSLAECGLSSQNHKRCLTCNRGDVWRCRKSVAIRPCRIRLPRSTPSPPAGRRLQSQSCASLAHELDSLSKR
jgi:hypothetical protein